MLILVEFQVFTKISSLSTRLVIPMLQIVIKHKKLSLFVRFLRGVPFFFCSLLVLPLTDVRIRGSPTDRLLITIGR